MMNEKKIERWILPGLIAVFCLSNLAWLVLDTAPPRSDSIYYIQGSYKFLEALRSEGIAGIASIPGLVRYRPPLQSLAGAFITLFTGQVPDRIVFLNVIWLGLTVWIVYRLGKRLSGPAAGILSALFFMTNPFVHEYLYQYETEVPLLFIVSMTLWSLCRIVDRGRRSDYLLLGILLACGLLFKWVYAVIAFPPVFLTMVWTWRREASKTFSSWKGWGIVFVVPAVAALPWYLSQYQSLLSYQADVARLKFYTPFTEGWSWMTAVYYPSLLAVKIKIVHSICFLAGLVCCVVSVWRNRDERIRVFFFALVLTLFVPWLYFIFNYHNLAQKYLLPVQPVVAVIASHFLLYTRGRMKTIVLSILCGLLVLISIHTQWGISLFETRSPETAMGIWLKPESGICTYPSSRPRKIDIPNQALAETITERAKPLPRSLRVLTVPNIDGFSWFTFSVWLDAQHPGSRSFGVSKYRIVLDTIFHEFLITKRGQAHDEMIHRDILDPFRHDTTNRLTRLLEQPPDWFLNSHRLVRRYPFMEEQDSITLYERIRPLDGMEASEAIGFFADEIIQNEILWEQIEIIWRHLHDPARNKRAKHFHAALHGGDRDTGEALIHDYAQPGGSWYPYEGYAVAILAKRYGQTALAQEIFHALARSEFSCSEAAARQLDR